MSTRALTAACAVLACASIPAVFLPFVEDVSPLRVIREIGEAGVLLCLAIPFFVGPVLGWALVRQTLAGNVSGRERRIAWSAAVAAAAAVVTFAVLVLMDAEWSEYAPVWLMLAVTIGGIVIALRARRRNAMMAAVAAMASAYAGNALGCFWIFAQSEFQSGAYCAMAATAACVILVARAIR